MTELLRTNEQLQNGRPLGRFFLFEAQELEKFPPGEAYDRSAEFHQRVQRYAKSDQLLIASVVIGEDGSLGVPGMNAGPQTFPDTVRVVLDTRASDEAYHWVVEAERDRYDFVVRKDPVGGHDLTHREFTNQGQLLRQESHLGVEDQSYIEAAIHTIVTSDIVTTQLMEFQSQRNHAASIANNLRNIRFERPLERREHSELYGQLHKRIGFKAYNAAQNFQMPLVDMPLQDYIDIVSPAIDGSYVDMVQRAEKTDFLMNPPKFKELYTWLQDDEKLSYPQAQAAAKIILDLVDIRPPQTAAAIGQESVLTA
jgi:hypothetical protein